MDDHESGDSVRRGGWRLRRGRPFDVIPGAHRDGPRASPQVTEESLDELLERLWMIREAGEPDPEESGLRSEIDRFDAIIEQARRLGLVSVKNGRVSLAPHGHERAKNVIRRHRLTEVLFRELLDLEEEEIEPGACSFEHILSPRATDSICTLLGHPPACPHGMPIPRGECCLKLSHELSPLVVPLSELSPGEVARIAFMTPKSHARLDRLGALGIVPGSTIRLHQKRPSFVLSIGETDVAIDPEIAREIFVSRV